MVLCYILYLLYTHSNFINQHLSHIHPKYNENYTLIIISKNLTILGDPQQHHYGIIPHSLYGFILTQH